MLKKILIALAAISASVVLSGCATLFGSNDRSVKVTSNPGGAMVYFNGTPMGRAPQTIMVDSMFGGNNVTLKKPGYDDQTRQIQTSFQPIAILDILFWPSIIVDVLTGDLMKVTNHSMDIDMTKTPASA